MLFSKWMLSESMLVFLIENNLRAICPPRLPRENGMSNDLLCATSVFSVSLWLMNSEQNTP
jgi:hypothetical protein